MEPGTPTSVDDTRAFQGSPCVLRIGLQPIQKGHGSGWQTWGNTSWVFSVPRGSLLHPADVPCGHFLRDSQQR